MGLCQELVKRELHFGFWRSSNKKRKIIWEVVILARRNWQGSLAPAFLQLMHGWPPPVSPLQRIFLLRQRPHYLGS